MLEEPDIPDGLIFATLRAQYGLETKQVSFLPLGYDINTVVYRVETWESASYFLKLRQGNFDPNTVTLPQFLHRVGVRAIIPPLDTCQGQLFSSLGPYTTILYPFIPGKNGYEVTLNDRQWRELGSTLKQVHEVQVPAEILSSIPHEIYDHRWRVKVEYFLSQIDSNDYSDPVALELAAFMKVKRQLIDHMVGRANALAVSLRRQSSNFVLCHSDAHPGNYLIAESGEVFLVDWDNPIIAPPERDLMCFGGGMSGDQPGGMEERMFYQGYGQIEIDRKALAYYRYERILQDIAEFCTQILLTTTGGEDRVQSYQYFTSSFLPGSVVDAAFHTDPGAERGV